MQMNIVDITPAARSGSYTAITKSDMQDFFDHSESAGWYSLIHSSTGEDFIGTLIRCRDNKMPPKTYLVRNMSGEHVLKITNISFDSYKVLCNGQEILSIQEVPVHLAVGMTNYKLKLISPYGSDILPPHDRRYQNEHILFDDLLKVWWQDNNQLNLQLTKNLSANDEEPMSRFLLALIFMVYELRLEEMESSERGFRS